MHLRPRVLTANLSRLGNIVPSLNGGFALGGWVFGGFALGWQAFGGCALGWNAAMGGLALARDFALGGLAQAAQANTEIASQFMRTSPFFRRMEILSHYVGWLSLLG